MLQAEDAKWGRVIWKGATNLGGTEIPGGVASARVGLDGAQPIIDNRRALVNAIGSLRGSGRPRGGSGPIGRGAGQFGRSSRARGFGHFAQRFNFQAQGPRIEFDHAQGVLPHMAARLFNHFYGFGVDEDMVEKSTSGFQNALALSFVRIEDFQHDSALAANARQHFNALDRAPGESGLIALAGQLSISVPWVPKPHGLADISNGRLRFENAIRFVALGGGVLGPHAGCGQAYACDGDGESH